MRICPLVPAFAGMARSCCGASRQPTARTAADEHAPPYRHLGLPAENSVRRLTEEKIASMGAEYNPGRAGDCFAGGRTTARIHQPAISRHFHTTRTHFRLRGFAWSGRPERHLRWTAGII